MKLTQLETYTLGHLSLVRARTEDGAEGWGQMAPYNADISAQVFHRQVAPTVLGRDTDDVDALVDLCLEAHYKFTGSYLCRAIAGLDTALWDVKARRAGKSVCELLGGRPRAVPVYGSSMRRDIQPDAEAARMVRLRDEQGFRAFKCRVGSRMGHDADQWPGRTEQLLPALRKALGPSVSLFADANGAYTPQKAIAVGRLMEQQDLCHYEEPCPYPEIESSAEVAAALQVPVAGGEQDYSLAQWRRIVSLPAVDIVQPDICYLGGLSCTLRVARMAAEKGMPCTPHCANTSLIAVFTLHLLGAIPNAGPFMEHSIEPTPWTEGLFSPALKVRDGALAIPDGPGWGVEISRAWLEKAERKLSQAK